MLLIVVLHILHLLLPLVRILYARKHVVGVVEQRMVMGVISAVCYIQSSSESNFIVNDD